MNDMFSLSTSNPSRPKKENLLGNPNAVGIAGSAIAAGVDLANIDNQSYSNLEKGGYQATGLAAGAALGSYFGPWGTAAGAVVGTAYDLFSHNKRKKSFEYEKKKMGIRDWQQRLSSNPMNVDLTGQFYS